MELAKRNYNHYTHHANYAGENVARLETLITERRLRQNVARQSS